MDDCRVMPFVNLESVHSLDLPSSGHPGEWLLDDYPLNLFTHLRFLDLSYQHSFHLPLTELASLEYLQTLTISHFHGSDASRGGIIDLLNLIFNDNSTAVVVHLRSTLKTLRIATEILTDVFRPDKFRPSKTNIQYLKIRTIHFDDFIRVFPSLELVRSINVEFGFCRNTIGKSFVFHDVDIDPILLSNCSVLTLPLSNTTFSFVHMEYLLKCTPNLNKLTIDLHSCYSELRENYCKWKALLVNHAKNLQKFEFTYWWNTDPLFKIEYDWIEKFQTVFSEASKQLPHPEDVCTYVKFTVHFKR
jgi:hypothetical protein